jgi:hypothetical protein
MSRRMWLLTALVACAAVLSAQDPTKWTRSQQEEFLREAKVVESTKAPGGITGSSRLTLERDGVRHDAHFQSINERKTSFQSAQGTELNFKDNYKYNVAAYRLDQLLGFDFVPTSIERKVPQGLGAVTWWVDDFLMVEKERWQKKIDPPNKELWNQQMRRIRVLNELIYNTDPNLGNFVITKAWKIWSVDFTRAFRTQRKIRNKKNLEAIDRDCVKALKALTPESLATELEDVLTKSEIRGIVERRVLILEFFAERAAKLGEDDVLYDWEVANP